MTAEAAPSIKKKILTYVAVLTGVCLAAALGVSVIYVVSRDQIAKNEEKAFMTKLSEVFGDAGDPKPIGGGKIGAESTVYAARTSDGVRYAAIGSARGYQSSVVVLVSVDVPKADTPVEGDPAIYRLVALPTTETPGLGENIHSVTADVSLWGAMAGQGEESGEKRPSFQEHFTGKRLSDLVVEKKADTAKILPITGATITSTAVTKAARQAVQRIMDKTKELYAKP